MLEEWKWVSGFEGLYKVSNMGRIMSFHSLESGRILSTNNKTGDYLRIVLCGNEKRRSVSMHVLVAEAFLGEIPEGYHVHHKDGNKQNNCISNLEVISSASHTMKTMAMNPNICTGMNNYNKYERPRRICQYSLDGYFIAQYANCKVASHYTGVCQRNILQVAKQDEYKPGVTRRQAGGFVWKFSDGDE